MTSQLSLQSDWTPQAWCGATLRLCERHRVETEREIVRYPEQWAFVLWRPSAQALPFRRPNCWGLSVGRPEPSLAEAIAMAPLYLLESQQCLWSSWLDLILIAGLLEPWLTELLQQARDRERDVERARYQSWFGSERQDFEEFMTRTIGRA